MLVYGDRSEEVDPRVFGEALAARSRIPAAAAFDISRHARIASLLIDMGKLAQGLADAAFEAEGADSDAYTFAPIAAVQFAASTAISWQDGWDYSAKPANALTYLLENDLPESVVLREPEGYAFYALYPELYAEAAGAAAEGREGLSAVIGIRSIGMSLGAAAAFAGGYPPITLRPFGDPFARKIAVTRGLQTRLERRARTGVLVVDEGPGASGSSFGAVGDLLDGIGVPPERVTYMPSHMGDVGPLASDRHRARWSTAKKAYASFEDVILPRLPGWVEPLIGTLTEPLRDLSGGRWRELVGDAPAWPQQERRKYLAVTGEGRFLLKFAGLGGIGPRKLGRAQALHAAGFTPEPLGLAHGFLVERWIDASTPLVPAHVGTQTFPGSVSQDWGDAKQAWVPAFAGMSGEMEAVGGYLGWRARSLAPPHGAADDALLRTMMTRNFGLAGLQELAVRPSALSAGERGPPCAIDGRLHAWEWRRSPGGSPLKLDALDHCEAHDLVGAQDVAWDLAGAAVEFGLDPVAAERLRRIVEAQSGQALDPRRVMFQTLAYLAFQIGWWTFAAQGGGGATAAAQARRYTDRAREWRPDA